MDIQQGIVNGVIRVVTATFAGGGLVSMSTSWVGKSAYSSLLHDHGVFASADVPEKLFAKWSEQVLLPDNPALTFSLLLLPLLLMLGHVLYRPDLDREDETPRRRLPRLYASLYFPLTLVLFFLFMVGMVTAPSRSVHLAFFFLLAVPAAVFLVLYCRDIQCTGFKARFTWASVALLFVVALVLMPQVQGQRFFNPQVKQMQLTETGTHYEFCFSGPPETCFLLDYDSQRDGWPRLTQSEEKGSREDEEGGTWTTVGGLRDLLVGMGRAEGDEEDTQDTLANLNQAGESA